MDKPKFTVIKGKNRESALTKQKWELYKAAYDNLLLRFPLNVENNDIADTLCKMFFYGTRYITLKHNADRKGIFEQQILNYDELVEDFAFVDLMYKVMEHLTLNQIKGIFPLDKDYDGEKYCCKDYFYATEHLKGINPDDLLCNQFSGIHDFTLIYCNREIFELDAILIDIASDIRRCEGKKGIVEEWIEEMGIESYIISTDGTMTNNRGEKIAKIKPNSGLKVIKNI